MHKLKHSKRVLITKDQAFNNKVLIAAGTVVTATAVTLDGIVALQELVIDGIQYGCSSDDIEFEDNVIHVDFVSKLRII